MSGRLLRLSQQLEPEGLVAVAAAADATELIFGAGSETMDLDDGTGKLRDAVFATLKKLGPRERVLILPPVRCPIFRSA
jgi:hypothetical protein